MSSYEFWDELGKIFNAVVAYQEKNLEFNKRFINPWIRLGNVFDKQDRSKEAIEAYEKAIELDPENAQNWFEVGNVHFKMESHDKAIEAFNKAIELDPSSGWFYNNLALTLASQGGYAQAIALYQKGIDLLQEDKDKAVGWNRLGNAYRKLNQYELALEAFHKADELDQDNAGFRDDLDEVSQAPTLVQSSTDGTLDSTTVTVSPIELIVADSRAEEDQARGMKAVGPAQDPAVDIAAGAVSNGLEVDTTSPNAGADAPDTSVAQPALEPVAAAPADSVVAESSQIHPPVAPMDAEDGASPSIPAVGPGEETVTVVVQDTIETFTATVTPTDNSDAVLDAHPEVPRASANPVDDHGSNEAESGVSEDTAVIVEADSNASSQVAAPSAAGPLVPEPDLSTTQPTGVAPSTTDILPIPQLAELHSEPTVGEETLRPSAAATDVAPTQDPGPLNAPEHVAYEEFLKDSNEPIHIYEPEAGEAEELSGPHEPVAKIDPSGELQIEMDTKNAHVWNELGNVYFNTSAFDDAIVAYSKAIELDRWFAWPYSNLALAYVQKRRFVEAILLYQRSIELFTGEKDKAISWNRLGNVYRRLNDYENAIAAYQRADELDPENTTLSLQSRFSLLGTYALEQKPSYVS